MTTARELWSLFLSLPAVVQVWLVLLALVVLAGVWSLSMAVGRFAGWVDEHRVPCRAMRLVCRRREWRVRLARRGPRWWVDRQARSLLAALEPSGDDLEEADR